LYGSSDVLSKCGFEGNVPPPNDIDRRELPLQYGDNNFHANEGTADHDELFPFHGGWGDGQRSSQAIEWSRRKATCVNPDRITDASESENVLKVGTRDGELLGLASRRKDEFIIVNELFASFQHDLFSRNVDGGDGLIICALFRHAVMGFRNSTYSGGAQGNAEFNPQIGSGHPFDFGGIGDERFAQLRPVIPMRRMGEVSKDAWVDLSMGECGSLDTAVIGPV